MCSNERGRPAGAASDDEHQGDGDVGSIVRRAAADDAAMRYWYRLGYEAGWQVGNQYAHHEIAEQDRRRAARMHGLDKTPQYRELERLRWGGRREDFGQPRVGDFPGFGADYEPSDRRARNRRGVA
jgi:hypothetical protein